MERMESDGQPSRQSAAANATGSSKSSKPVSNGQPSTLLHNPKNRQVEPSVKADVGRSRPMSSTSSESAASRMVSISWPLLVISEKADVLVTGEAHKHAE